MSQRNPVRPAVAGEPSTAHEDQIYRPALRSIPGARRVPFLLVPAGISGLLGAVIPGAWPLLLFMSALGFFVVVAAAVGLLLFATRVGDRVRLSPSGIEHQAGTSVVRMTWDEVAWVQVHGVSLWGLIPINTCQIGTGDGRTLRFDNMFADFEAIVARVGQETAPRLLAAASACITAGHDAGFGAVTACAAGLKHDGGLLPWRAIDAYHVDDGTLFIHSRDPASPSLAVRLARIDNLEVLIQLTERMVGKASNVTTIEQIR